MRARIIDTILLCVCCATVLPYVAGEAPGDSGVSRAVSTGPAGRAQEILAATGVQGGLVVHLGCGDGTLTAALGEREEFLVQGLDVKAENVAAARKRLQASGAYGRISVGLFTGRRLPYVENSVNLIVAEDVGNVERDELLRVLAPSGVAYVKQDGGWDKIVKPRPDSIDEWNHYLHDPSNNAVAHDQQVGSPRHLQWTCGPSWSRHHDHMASMSAMVSDNGRVFYILDEGPREAILLPPQWSLIARDAFSGVLLWKRAIDEWNTHLWPLKSGPNQLPRRLVAADGRVYVTLGINAPVTALDAATGETVTTYQGTEYTDEILLADATLFLLAGKSPNKWTSYRPNSTYVWDNPRRANTEWAWDQAARSLMAIDAETGSVKWKQDQRVVPLTLGLDAQHVVLFTGEELICVSRTDGKLLWKSAAPQRKNPFPTGYGPTLVIEDGVVLLSVENRAMTAFAVANGETLWSAPHHPGGHASPDDMLVVNGVVWSGAVAGGQDTGVFTGRDIHTGEIKREFPPDVNPPWFHHRCYRSRATDRYFIASRTGIELIDLGSQHWDINHWVRAGCLYGFMPCNGLIYATPHSCGCFLESKLFGFNALAGPSPAREVPRDAPVASVLEKGPAYDDPLSGKAAGADEWPLYRHDAERSGSVKTAVPAKLAVTWQATLGGRLSSVVAAEDKVLVAAIDAHTVHALDAATGTEAWAFTAGARIDSPPAIYQGRVLFGSSDGYVYCLRVADGALAWRFRAAPREERLMAHEQLESVWPVSGSVLVHDGVVYCVAGRSAFLDGGLRLVRLDPRTGEKLSETVIDDRVPDTEENLQARIQGQDMPVALPDILSCDGRSVYMRSQAFDLAGNRREIKPIRLDRVALRRGAASADDPNMSDIRPHLFSRTGFLDDSWFWRSYWVFGQAVDSNYGGWLRPGHFAPCGRLMVFDDQRIFGFDRKPEYLCNASVQEYYLYGADRELPPDGLQRVQAATNRMNAESPNKSASSSDWALRKKYSLTEQNPARFLWAQGNPQLQARALVLADELLFVAGPPDVLDEEEALRAPDAPAIQAKLTAQAAALKGKMGGQLLVLSAKDGQKLAAYELEATPSFDGMAAARGKLFMSTLDGRLLCLSADGQPLRKATDSPLAPLDTTPKPIQDVPAKAALNSEFSSVARVDVTACDLGYHVLGNDNSVGIALKKLPVPVSGKILLKCRLRVADDGRLKNGFLAFGETDDPAALIQCGLRFAMKKATVAQGSLDGNKTVSGVFEPDAAKTYDLQVLVDLPAGTVTLQVDGTTVTARLDKPPQSLSYVGYTVVNAGCDFSAVELALP